MSILVEIVQQKRKEIERAKERFPVTLLEESVHFSAPTVSLKQYLRRADKHGIISEIKRRSPSKGWINEHISVEGLSIGYMQAGSSALSVLTDKKFFGGSLSDLRTARRFNYCPLLRKDFVLDEYQIIEAKSYGADAILLIAAILAPETVWTLARFARSMSLEVLLEVHTEEEVVKYLHDDISCVGVNNRDLDTFQTSLETSLSLAPLIPSSFLRVAESGISEASHIKALRAVGYEGFLIGEQFMKHPDPAKACAHFIHQL